MNCSGFFRRSTWIAFALACAPSARAELLVGDAGDQTPAAVLTYADSAAGAATPLGSFSTAAGNGIAPLQDPSSLTFDPLENVVYVADFYGQAIRVYRAGAVGNVAPLRTLNPSLLGQPRQVALSTLHDELIIATGCCVITYGRYLSGTQAVPSRYLPPSYTPEGSSTRLNNPGGIVLRTSSDEIIIPDTGNGPNNTYFGVVLFFPRSLTGNSSPYRTLEGAQTLLGTSASHISQDEVHDEIYVSSQDSATYPYGLRISTFAGSASGNVAPLRSIGGDATQLEDIHQIFYDDISESLYVSVGGENGVAPKVLVFARGANGNVAPDRTIIPNGASFSRPEGLTVVFDDLFHDSFE
jgi:hypothetical protein